MSPVKTIFKDVQNRLKVGTYNLLPDTINAIGLKIYSTQYREYT